MSIEVYEDFNGNTIIGAHGKTLVVNHSVDRILQGKYDYEFRGEHIQDAFPFLTADEREFILTGITAEEWDELLYDLEEIIEKKNELNQMCAEWESGDAESQACSDPGLQYQLEEEIEGLIKAFKVKVLILC